MSEIPSLKSKKSSEEKLLLQKYFEKEAVKLKAREVRLADFCKKTGLDRDRYREQVFATDTERKLGFGRSTSAKAVAQVKKSVDNARESGIIKIYKVVTGHNSTPKISIHDRVIEHQTDNKTDVRSFYDNNGMKEKDIHTTNHGNPKTHPYGKNGEHAHDYIWDENGVLKTKTTREISKKEREEN